MRTRVLEPQQLLQMLEMGKKYLSDRDLEELLLLMEAARYYECGLQAFFRDFLLLTDGEFSHMKGQVLRILAEHEECMNLILEGFDLSFVEELLRDPCVSGVDFATNYRNCAIRRTERYGY